MSEKGVNRQIRDQNLRCACLRKLKNPTCQGQAIGFAAIKIYRLTTEIRQSGKFPTQTQVRFLPPPPRQPMPHQISADIAPVDAHRRQRPSIPIPALSFDPHFARRHERPQRIAGSHRQFGIAPRRVLASGQSGAGSGRASGRAGQFGSVDIGDADAFGTAADRITVVHGKEEAED